MRTRTVNIILLLSVTLTAVLAPSCARRDVVRQTLKGTAWAEHPDTVVKVQTRTTIANGVIVQRSGQWHHVLTANHAALLPWAVVMVRKTGLLGVGETWSSHFASVVWRDPGRDLAILRFEHPTPLPFARLGPAHPGEIYMFSHRPAGQHQSILSIHLFNVTVPGSHHFRATSTKHVIKGQSGSPVFYKNGNLAGIVVGAEGPLADFSRPPHPLPTASRPEE